LFIRAKTTRRKRISCKGQASRLAWRAVREYRGCTCVPMTAATIHEIGKKTWERKGMRPAKRGTRSARMGV